MKIKVIKKEKAKFRILIKDLSTGKFSTVNLAEHATLTKEDIKLIIEDCFENLDEKHFDRISRAYVDKNLQLKKSNKDLNIK